MSVGCPPSGGRVHSRSRQTKKPLTFQAVHTLTVARGARSIHHDVTRHTRGIGHPYQPVSPPIPDGLVHHVDGMVRHGIECRAPCARVSPSLSSCMAVDIRESLTRYASVYPFMRTRISGHRRPQRSPYPALCCTGCSGIEGYATGHYATRLQCPASTCRAGRPDRVVSSMASNIQPIQAPRYWGSRCSPQPMGGHIDMRRPSEPPPGAGLRRSTRSAIR